MQERHLTSAQLELATDPPDRLAGPVEDPVIADSGFQAIAFGQMIV